MVSGVAKLETDWHLGDCSLRGRGARFNVLSGVNEWVERGEVVTASQKRKSSI